MNARALALVLFSAVATAGCASLVQNASDQFARNLGAAVMNNDDPASVRDGLPAYLLLLDALILGQKEGEAGNAGTLLAAAELNGAYAGNFVGDDKARARRLSTKAMEYARRATCLRNAAICAALDKDVEGFQAAVNEAGAGDAALMYGLAVAWVGFLQSNSEDWGAIADLPKVEALLQRVVTLDPDHARGLPHVYLGVLNSLRPEAIGGKPEVGRAHFERALAISQGRNLYAKTLMAEFYARLLFDQELHDRLLNEVLAADARAPDFTLMNTLAQERAVKLLGSGKDYF